MKTATLARGKKSHIFHAQAGVTVMSGLAISGEKQTLGIIQIPRGFLTIFMFLSQGIDNHVDLSFAKK